MRYYTKYSLSVNMFEEDLIREFRESCENASFAINSDGEYYSETKWYDHENYLKSFSVLHPNALFVLYGIGEDDEDMWVKYFKNGKMQVCKAQITYEDFDELKLR